VIGANVLAALADHDGDFPFIIKALGALGIRNPITGSGNCVGIFPKTPLALFTRHSSDLGKIAGDAGTTRPHTGEMGGIIATDAGNPPARPRAANFHIPRIINDRLCGIFPRMLDGTLRILYCG
jgi:hypothetical protein